MNCCHSLSPYCFNDQVVSGCFGIFKKTSLVHCFTAWIGGGVSFALLNKGMKIWCDSNSPAGSHMFEICCHFPENFTELMRTGVVVLKVYNPLCCRNYLFRICWLVLFELWIQVCQQFSLGGTQLLLQISTYSLKHWMGTFLVFVLVNGVDFIVRKVYAHYGCCLLQQKGLQKILKTTKTLELLGIALAVFVNCFAYQEACP